MARPPAEPDNEMELREKDVGVSVGCSRLGVVMLLWSPGTGDRSIYPCQS